MIRHLAFVLLLILAALGCGGKAAEPRVNVSGRLTSDGQPLTVAGEEAGLGYVQIAFYRIEDDGTQSTDPESARVGKDGSYQLSGAEGRGIPPGTYRIVVRQWDPYPTDKLNAKFDEVNSPIRRSISEDATVDIDLAKESS